MISIDHVHLQTVFIDMLYQMQL